MLSTSSTGTNATWAHEVIHDPQASNSRLQAEYFRRHGSTADAREEAGRLSWAPVLLGDRLGESGLRWKAMPAYMGHWIRDAQGVEQQVLFQVLSEARQRRFEICRNSLSQRPRV